MRKVIVFNAVSLDGYHTGLDNDIAVMFPMMGDVFDAYTADLLRSADIHLVGRVSFELFQSFWPKVAEDRDSAQWTDEQRNLSSAAQAVRGVVVSDSLDEARRNLTIVRRADAHQYVTELKREEGKNILITGSRTLWNDLLAHDLVDEIHLLVGNHALGRGVPAFKTPATLRLLDARPYPDADRVLLRYAVTPGDT